MCTTHPAPRVGIWLLSMVAATGCGTTTPFRKNSPADGQPWPASEPIAATKPKPPAASSVPAAATDPAAGAAVVPAAHSAVVAQKAETPPAAVAVPAPVPPTASDAEMVHPPVAEPAPGRMTLQDLESMAMANNPTIRELAATTQKAAGFRTQVGLRANPTAGYQGQQIADKGTDQHMAFVEQEFVTGGKLQLNRQVLNAAARAQLLELEAQRMRVATDVRTAFYDALAAQKRIALIQEFRGVVNQGLKLAQLRKQAMEGSQVDVLQSSVQRSEVELALQQALQTQAAVWRQLAALTGNPTLQQTELEGELPHDFQAINWDQLGASLVSASPEYSAAQARVNRARANLERQEVQAIPNVTTQLAAGVDNGTNASIINLQVGAPIPVFNKNQGNIAAARAEFTRATLEMQRIENAIKARLAIVSRDFETASAAVAKYSQEILPSAAEGLKLAELAYQSGETSFIQVLVARRTYFDTNLQYVAAQTQLAQAQAKLDGFVLTGALDPVIDQSGDDSLRGQTFSQQ
ncbi:MAG: TolC family protein [Aureliella sp.]